LESEVCKLSLLNKLHRELPKRVNCKEGHFFIRRASNPIEVLSQDLKKAQSISLGEHKYNPGIPTPTFLSSEFNPGIEACNTETEIPDF
jgi:hypothetical protein